MTEKEKFMREALKQAKRAYEKGEIPVGAVIVKDNKIFYEKEIKINAELFSSSKIVCVCIRQPIYGPASLFA